VNEPKTLSICFYHKYHLYHARITVTHIKSCEKRSPLDLSMWESKPEPWLSRRYFLCQSSRTYILWKAES